MKHSDSLKNIKYIICNEEFVSYNIGNGIDTDIENNYRMRTDSDTQTTSTDFLDLNILQNKHKLTNGKDKKINQEIKNELLNKLICILLHIFLMSIFEILFYFYFVIYIEKDLFIKQILHYNTKIESIYNDNLNNEEQIVFQKVVDKIYNDDVIDILKENYKKSLIEQAEVLEILFKKSLMYSSTIFIILILTYIYGYKKLKYKWIIFENLLLFIFLGVYEYIFFTNIILKYTPITDEEIEYIFTCNTLSSFNISC